METIELPDAAHYPQIERPDLISAALGSALGQMPEPKRTNNLY